uniref:DNA replication and repair protein RecF n=1 Tax=Candidatus Methanophagaceae archaeon ANME-1 ERB6 TaxID=2759912 RepID=A0A7G9YZF8_9EURY|nr:DNA replication and repair protein RecF [Methanosarcinales archaeon ANME-1 ERB6]
MKIEAFTIKNYRSIKELKIENLNPVNVVFGKNNVGKSNILRGLHLAFFCLKSDEMFLPDTVFYNRNIYKPIEVKVDLILEEDFYDTEKVDNALREGIEQIHSALAYAPEIFEDSEKEVEQFIEKSESFKPLKKLSLKVHLDYNEETTDIDVSIEDLESDYRFDYKKYQILHEKLKRSIRERINDKMERLGESVLSRLPSLAAREYLPLLKYRVSAGDVELGHYMDRLKRYVKDMKDTNTKGEIFSLIEQYEETFHDLDLRTRTFSKTFNIVKGYFGKISDNFILIPNKEYFSKGPFVEKGGKQIEIFNINRFYDKLASLIESPGKKERELIKKFNGVWSRSYRDFGELEIRKFQKRVFAIFDTGFNALPIENQGLGIQDLFLYLAYMILFDPAVIAIEEPEGGLSTENQITLHNIIEDVYSGSDKQIFISSHSKEFETPSSYIIEMSKGGTTEISRREAEKEYEEKIEGILINRRLEKEKAQYEALLREVTEREITLDILNYISKLGDEEKVDAQKISDELGYKKEKVKEVLSGILMKKTK